MVEESGGEIVGAEAYDPQATTFDSEVDEVAAGEPDAIWVFGFQEASRILRAMVEKGIGPTDEAVYGCDGNIANATGVELRRRQLTRQQHRSGEARARARALSASRLASSQTLAIVPR